MGGKQEIRVVGDMGTEQKGGLMQGRSHITKMQVACGGRERLGSGFSSHKPPEGTSSAHTLIYPGEADFGASDPPDREETCVLAPKSAVMC